MFSCVQNTNKCDAIHVQRWKKQTNPEAFSGPTVFTSSSLQFVHSLEVSLTLSLQYVSCLCVEYIKNTFIILLEMHTDHFYCSTNSLFPSKMFISSSTPMKRSSLCSALVSCFRALAGLKGHTLLYWLRTLQCAQAHWLNFSNSLHTSHHCVTICYYFQISHDWLYFVATLPSLLHCLCPCSHVMPTFFPNKLPWDFSESRSARVDANHFLSCFSRLQLKL